MRYWINTVSNSHVQTGIEGVAARVSRAVGRGRPTLHRRMRFAIEIGESDFKTIAAAMGA